MIKKSKEESFERKLCNLIKSKNKEDFFERYWLWIPNIKK